MEEILNKCTICSTEESEYFLSANDNLGLTNKSFELVKCKNCGVIRLKSPPDEVEMEDYYPDYYFTGEPIVDTPLNLRKTKLVDKFCERGRILDYGCGDFSFLLALKGKWEKFLT